VTGSEALEKSRIPIKSEFFRGSDGGFFSFPLVAFWPSLLSFEASAMLVPELEAREEAADMVNMRAVGDEKSRISHPCDHLQPYYTLSEVLQNGEAII
jgi:hypothetical protein